MISFPVHTPESAPQAAQQDLTALKRSIGMIPNLAGSMAESPPLLRGFLALREIFYGGSFTPVEVQALALANACVNACRYCMALHSTFALKVGVPQVDVLAMRGGEAAVSPRLRALTTFSRALLLARGHVSQSDLEAFLAAGFSRAQALEVVLGVAVSILPNYAHQITGCAIDEAFLDQRWEPAT